MPIKAIIDTLDDVSEDLRALYRGVTEGELKGRFVLDVEPASGYALEHIDGLKSAYTTVKAELETTKKALDGFKGLSAKDTRDKLRDYERLKAIDPASEADRLAQIKMQSTLDDLTKTHTTALGELEAKANRYRQSIDTLMVRDNAVSAIAKHKGVAELLLPVITPRVRVTETDTGFAIQVLDENGNPEIAVRDGKPVPATIEDLVVKLKSHTVFGRAFEASGQTGSGARGSTTGGGAGVKNPFAAATFNLTEQMKLIKDNPSLASALQAAAG